MSSRQFSNQDVYQDGRVRFVGVQVVFAGASLSVDRRDDRLRLERVMTLEEARLTRSVGAVHTFTGVNGDGQQTTLKVLPNSRRGCGCGKRT